MSSVPSNRKPASKSEAPQEPFKRAVAGCMRAMSGVKDLEVTYAAERPGVSGTPCEPIGPRPLISRKKI